MFEIEAIAAVRDFVERGGNVLYLIGAVTIAMWVLILERFWYYRRRHPGEARRALLAWMARTDHSTWYAHQIRRLLVGRVQQKLDQGIRMIKTLVALCPMLGLLGTVTGMIEVFDVMAIAGTGNVRGMAGGVSKATLPTMAGMLVALSGMVFAVQLERFARDEGKRVADRLAIEHGQEAAT